MKRLLFRVGLIAAGLVIGLTLGWLAIRGVNWGEVLDALRRVSLFWAVVALAFFILSAYLRAVRWRLLWVREQVGTFRLLIVENASLGVNNILPIRASAEAVQFGLLTVRDQLPAGGVIATMMMTRILDLAFTFAFILMIMAFLPVPLPAIPIVIGSLAFLGAWLVVLLNLGRVLRWFPKLRDLPLLPDIEKSMAVLLHQKGRMALSFGVTALFWAALGPVGWALARGIDVELPVHLALVTVVGAIFFATTVPGPPGALGTFEFVVVFLLGLWDVPRESAVTFAILLHAIIFVPPVLLALAVLPNEGFRSIDNFREIVGRWKEARKAT